jgi:hypothetical protein
MAKHVVKNEHQNDMSMCYYKINYEFKPNGHHSRFIRQPELIGPMRLSKEKENLHFDLFKLLQLSHLMKLQS